MCRHDERERVIACLTVSRKDSRNCELRFCGHFKIIITLMVKLKPIKINNSHTFGISFIRVLNPMSPNYITLSCAIVQM